MTAYTIPPNQTKIPLILNAGDTLTVDLRGRSTDVTVNDGATEDVNVGGSSFRVPSRRWLELGRRSLRAVQPK